MKKTLFIVAGLVGVLAVLGFVFRDVVGFMAAMLLLQPNHGFEEGVRPVAPDYSDTVYWAALPDRGDAADRIPAGDAFADIQASADADVFFIHPTTFISAEGWNQALDNEEVNGRTDAMVMTGQASVFNGCCKVYAPRYRQATLYSFMDDDGNGERALALAYQDVLAAFEFFVEHYNASRPFIVAGHSQGAKHADKLLREVIAGTPLEARMVAAYPVGFTFAQTDAPVPVCATPEQTGCMVTWNSVGPDVAQFRDASNDICVNPLTWQTDGAAAAHDTNAGAVAFSGGDVDLMSAPEADSNASNGVPEPGAADAHCKNGQLLVSEIRSTNFSSEPMGEDNYHIYDYALFAVNIRENAKRRVAAFSRGM